MYIDVKIMDDREEEQYKEQRSNSIEEIKREEKESKTEYVARNTEK